jgi:hypothetical protein
MQATDLLKTLETLQDKGQTLSESAFRDGYLMGIRHAIELVHVMGKEQVQ